MKNKTKRIVSLLLTIIMMVTSVSLTAFAEDTAEELAVSIAKNGSDILSNVQGEGFFDNSEAGTPEIDGVNICLRGGSDDSTHEWARYSIDADISGTYEVSLTYTTGSDEWYEIINETTGETKKGIVSASASWSDPATTSQWNENNEGTKTIIITLNKGENIIKVKKLYGPSYLFEIKFDYKIVKNGSDILSNVQGEGFFDNSEAGTPEISGTNICLIGGSDDSTHEWAKYGVDAVIPGTYEVTLSYSTYAGCDEWYEITNEATGETKKGIVSAAAAWNAPATTSQWNENNEGTKTITFTLNEGSNIIKVKKLYGPSCLYKIEFKLIERAPVVEEEPAVTIEKNGSDILSGGQGVGYFDASAEGTPEISGTNICLRGGSDDSTNEWARYSVDAVIPGTYEVTLSYTTWDGYDEWYEITNETTEEAKKGVVVGSTSWGDPATTSNWNESGEGTKTITFTLKKGSNIIKVKKLYGPSCLYKMEFKLIEKYSFKVDGNDYISVDGEKGKITTDTAYAMPIIRPDSNHLGFAFNEVSGRYNVTLCGGGNINNKPIFILKNLNTGETIEVATTTEKDYHDTDYYEMGEITFFTGDEYEVSIIESPACLREIVFTYVDEPVHVVECKNVINKNHGDGYFDNGGENLFELVEYDTSICLRTEDWIKNSVTVPVAGTYEVIFSRGHEYGERFVIENLTTNSSVDKEATATGAYNKYVDFSMGTIKMAAGENIIKTTNKSNAAYAHALKFLLISEDKPTVGVTFTEDDIESTTADVVDGNITMDTSDFVVFDAAFDDADYEVYINIIDTTVDSLIRVSTLSGSSEAYKFVKSETAEEIAVPVKFRATDEKLKIDVIAGEVTIDSVSTDYAITDNYSALSAAFYEAEDAASVKEVFDEYGYDLWIDIDSDIEGIYYTDSVFNTLLAKVHPSVQGFASAYNRAVYKERTSPSIVLKDSTGTAVTELVSGAMTLEVNADWIDEGTEVAFAVYAENRLVSVDMKEASINGITLEVTVPETDGVTYKLLFWEKDSIKPYTVKSNDNYVYVSASNGDDNNNGTEDAPVASFDRAKEIANEKKNLTNANIYVELAAGEYKVDNEIVFSSEDSGSELGYVIYSGDPNGGTVVTGGEKLESWTEEDGLYTTVFSGSESLRQLEVNQNAAEMSKSGEITATSLYQDGDETALYDGIIVKTADLHEDILGETAAEVVWNNKWQQYRFPVVAIEKYSDTETVLKLSEEFKYLENKTANDEIDYSSYEKVLEIPFTIENTRCYTDEPGEYFYDGAKIYYSPKDGEAVDKMVVYAPVSEGLMKFAGNEGSKVKNIVVENITFKNGTWNRPSENGLYIRQSDKYDTGLYQPYERGGDLIRGQITLDWCDNVIFRNNIVKNVGSTAIVLNEGVTNCKVENNEIFNTAAGAVRVGNHMHTDGQDSVRCKDNSVYNNKIYDVTLQYTSSPAISVFYAQSTSISHNDIKNCAYSGISVGWGWGEYVTNANGHTIEGNKIENVMTKMQDGSHIYTLGAMEGTVIRGNHLIKSSESGDNGNGRSHRGGIYFDNGSAGITVCDNVIEQCSDWLFAVDENLGTADPGNDDVDIIDCPIKVYNNYSDTSNYVNKADNVNVTPAGSISSESAQAIIANAGNK